MVGRGRIEELKRLEAGERALADAWRDYAQSAPERWAACSLSERHRQHALALAWRLMSLGDEPGFHIDDEWVSGPHDDLQTLLRAEQAARLTYHDHLGDFDPRTRDLIRERILPDQEALVAELSGDDAWGGFADMPPMPGDVR
ncbi:MAG TPA: hypothetical protein VIA18_17765 [Polyangia bacterium]|nr:hypothetical protein [Polyangia bacterium]HWE26810.1 hypothetical protein [Polyangia bacterium]